MDIVRPLVVDLLARARGRRYTSFDVVGAGPRVVAGILEYVGYRTNIICYENILRDPDTIIDYDIFLLSAMSSDKGALTKIVSIIRRRTKAPIIVGGPIGFEFYDILRNIDVDLIIVGEGEIPLINLFSNHIDELLNKELDSLRDIKGLAYKSRNKIVFTGFPGYTSYELLNSIKPYTRVHHTYEHVWLYRFYVEVVRGCSNYYRPLVKLGYGRDCIRCMICRKGDLDERLYCPKGIPPGCGFCSVPLQFGPPRSRSIDAIVNEVKELVKNGATRIVLSAPDFLDYGRELLVAPKPLTDPCNPKPNYRAIEELLQRLHGIPEISSGEVKLFIENVKACLVDTKAAKIIGRFLKGTTIHIGLETGDRKYNEEVIGKPISVEDVVNASRLFRNNGLRPYVYLIYGLPYMRSSVYIETVKALNKLWESGVEKITLYKFTPLPLTAFELNRPEIHRFKKLISMLKKLVNKYNIRAKEKYFLGKTVEAYIVKSRDRLYGYPVLHGPVIFIENSGKTDANNCIGLVKITNVSARHVTGRIASIKKCFKR